MEFINGVILIEAVKSMPIKIHTYEGGTIDDNWYETFSKWVKQIP